VHIFYNNSAWDGDAGASANDDIAIATDKSVLLPGQTAAFANYTSYNKGLNGVMVDIANLAGTPTTADVACVVGNDNTPASWATGPTPTSVTVRAGAGTGSSSRVSIIWADGAITKTWVRVTAAASVRTGLAAPYVFYVGNAIGETGNSLADATVSGSDQLQIRLHSTAPLGAALTSIYDINRDKQVSGSDQLTCRINSTAPASSLKLISVP
jgi:hypothetical protein